MHMVRDSLYFGLLKGYYIRVSNVSIFAIQIMEPACQWIGWDKSYWIWTGEVSDEIWDGPNHISETSHLRCPLYFTNVFYQPLIKNPDCAYGLACIFLHYLYAVY